MNGQVNEWSGGWMNEKEKRMGGRLAQREDGWMDGWMDG